MTTRTKLTVRLPEENVEFVKRYAVEHGLTVTDLLDRYLTRLRDSRGPRPIHPSVKKISGLVPAEVDAEALYHQHLMDKHR
jgi:hypothetical protein